jgi:maltose alpha-D-glucosyltransferase/alpha-amylase
VEDRTILEPWGWTWYVWVAATFLKHYLEHTRGAAFLPRTRDELHTLLDAFLLEKALHELGHEAQYRRHWIGIPLAAILQILDQPNQG